MRFAVGSDSVRHITTEEKGIELSRFGTLGERNPTMLMRHVKHPRGFIRERASRV